MSTPKFQVISCTCDYQKNPQGIDGIPVFSWKMMSAFQGDYQIARQIIVAENLAALADDAKNKVWDSGKVMDEKNLSIYYEGVGLKPRTRYYWQVTAWNSQNQMAQGPISWFETGKRKEVWQAKWIGAPWCRIDKDDKAAIYLRKDFPIKKEIKSAHLYICGLGLYEAWLEGQRISDVLLEPNYTKYDARVLYRTYDVTKYLSGLKRAVLGVILGNGWYNCFTKDAWNTAQATWRSVPKLLCELYMKYADDTVECILSDTNWYVSKGAITFQSIRSGEHYDARLEEKHWNKSSFVATGWQPAIQMRGPGGIIEAAQGEPIRAVERLNPVNTYRRENRVIFDFGQNLAGKGEFTVTGPAGSEFIFRYAEELTADGEHVDQSHLSCFIREGEFQTDHYIKKSSGAEVWSSRFVYHGFRYIEVETADSWLESVRAVAVVMHSDLRATGFFECSDEGLNTIQRMCLWSSRSNTMGLPTSDPHREKNAWTGDNGFAAEQLLLNFDSFHILKRWLDSVCDCQRADGAIPCVSPSTGWGYNWGNGPDWSLVLTALPWLLYRQTADKRILEKYYPYVCKHFDFMRSMAVNGVVNYGIGDWCAPFDGPAVSVNMESFKAPTALTDTACYYEAADILDKMSSRLGRNNPYVEYKKEIRRAWQGRFVNKNLEVEGDCQTSDGCAVWNHILPPETEAEVLKRLVERIVKNDYHLDFGVLGQKYVMESLGEFGYSDILFKMLGQRSYPSYLYLAKNGCTTLAECWNLGGSHNHLMFSHVSAILYYYIAGLRPDKDAPGLTRFRLIPSFLTQTMKCSYDTPNGLLLIEWKLEDDRARLMLQIPFGTTADLTAPPRVRETGQKWHLNSGNYQFEWRL